MKRKNKEIDILNKQFEHLIKEKNKILKRIKIKKIIKEEINLTINNN